MATLLVLFIVALVVANGVLLTYLAIRQASFPVRLCYGAVVGLAALAWLSFLIALIAGMNAVTIAAVVVLCVAGLLALRRFVSRDQIRAEARAVSFDRWGVAYY